MDQTEIIKQLDKNINRGSSLDTLMQFDAVLDNLNVYAYKNWIEGEIVDGPHVERYWVTVTLLYPRKLMPDPDAAQRLIDNGCKVFYAKDTLITAAKLNTPDDREQMDGPDGQRPMQPRTKKLKRPVWLITVEMPRNYMDSITTGKIAIDDLSIDTEAVESAYDDNLGDDDAIRSTD